MPKSDEIRIDFHNIIGEKIATLLNKTLLAGNHQIKFNAQDLPSGLYVYKILIEQFYKANKMPVLK